jgi:hypothetical protein
VRSFRTKPVEIEAIQYDGSMESQRRIVNWSNGVVSGWAGDPAKVGNEGYYLQVATLEGTIRAVVGDWIIKGVQGEFYPCKPDIFEATYEPVEGAGS